ncbi:uncharacterized protein PRCAT00005539001 [Priceomyces carsonii]|uniref:uncharacterized protein n=1 Tax=Priceomyces carsonii TaxID=28549 RepID=UPI002ED84FE0|nr:unnamed protein product [Priceomyces carsonii]
MSNYPAYINDKPPVITLKEYDIAPWAKTTCVDRRDDDYVVVLMENPDQIIAKIDPKDYDVLYKVFNSAHQTYADQLVKEKLEKESKGVDSEGKGALADK